MTVDNPVSIQVEGDSNKETLHQYSAGDNADDYLSAGNCVYTERGLHGDDQCKKYPFASVKAGKSVKRNHQIALQFVGNSPKLTIHDTWMWIIQEHPGQGVVDVPNDIEEVGKVIWAGEIRTQR